MKPKERPIVVKGRLNPRWHYSRVIYMSIDTVPRGKRGKEFMVPCCLKSKPCWECR